MIVVGVIFSVFAIIYREIDVIGPSMKPLLNSSLPDNLSKSQYEASNIKDKVCVNRFRSGTRGDVVVFKRGNEKIIKRIIAVAGDTIDIKICPELNGRYTIYLNGAYQDEKYVANYGQDVMANRVARFQQLKASLGVSSNEPITVPSGYVFVLGDNREHSEDSINIGFIAVSDIIGRVDIIIPHDANFFQYYWIKLKGLFGVR